MRHDDHSSDGHDDHAHADDAMRTTMVLRREKPHETPWVVTLPLILLAIPSVIIGYIAIEPMLFGDYFKARFSSMRGASGDEGTCASLPRRFRHGHTRPDHAGFLAGVPRCGAVLVLVHEAPGYSGAIKAVVGAGCTPCSTTSTTSTSSTTWSFAGGARLLGRGLWKGGDAGLIDGIIVNGSCTFVGWFATLARFFQTGHIYHYAFTMIIGVFVLMTLWVTRA
jgi:NADH-quinone oxidoreductase subunit L